MRRRSIIGARPLIAGIMAVTLIRLAATGHHRQFVRAGMGPLLVIAGVVLGGLVLLSVLIAPEPATNAPDHLHTDHLHTDDQCTDEHEHDHVHEPAAHEHEGDSVGPGWLLLIPVLALFLVAPAPLGAWGLNRVGSSKLPSVRTNYPPLPASADPVPLRIREVVGRAIDPGNSLKGRTLSLDGFVVRKPGGFALARYAIACCAADANASQVFIQGAATLPATDSWVRVIATYHGIRGDDVVLDAVSLQPIAAPDDPFE